MCVKRYRMHNQSTSSLKKTSSTQSQHRNICISSDHIVTQTTLLYQNKASLLCFLFSLLFRRSLHHFCPNLVCSKGGWPYPVDYTFDFDSIYPLDSKLSSGKRYHLLKAVDCRICSLSFDKLSEASPKFKRRLHIYNN